MSLPKLLGAGLLACSLLPASSAEAHFPRLFPRRQMGMFNQCCAPVNPCCAPLHAPCCAPVAPVDPCGCGSVGGPVMQPIYGTQLQAVPQTTLVPQQVVTYQTVPQIQMQRQAYVEQVPVTTYQNVTRYRDVAVQVNTQVAQVQTQMVPQTTMGYVPVTAQVGTQIAGWQYGALPLYGAIPGATPTAAVSGITPIPEAAGVPVPVPQPAPYMQGASTSGEWSTIHQHGPSAAAPPTAATVWQSQLHTGAVAR